MAEDKVFDVAKPGTSQPQTGSKPMVVGHKTLASDPSIKEDKEGEGQSQEITLSPAPNKKIRLAPISEEVVEDTETPEPKEEVTIQSKVTEVEEPVSEPEKEEVKETETEEKPEPEANNPVDDQQVPDVDGKNKKQDDAQAKLQQEKEQQLNALIESKKYNLNIKESHGSSIKKFLSVLFVLALLAVVVGVALEDAEILDLGIELPFDLIK